MNRTAKGFLFAAAGGVFWGLSGIFAKFLFLDGINAVWLVSARLVFGGGLLVLWALIRQGKSAFRVFRTPGDFLRLILFAILGMFGVQFTYFMAIDASNPAVATILQYIFPVMVLFYTLLQERRHASGSELLVLALIVAGVFLLTTHGRFGELAISGKALFWGLLSAVSAAFYSIYPKRLLEEYGSASIVGWGMLIGSIPCLPFLFTRFDPAVLTGTNLALLLGVIVIGTALGFSFYLEGVHMVGPMIGSLLASVEPLTAAVCTVLFLGQVFLLPDIAGIVLILAGVTLLTVRPGRRAL